MDRILADRNSHLKIANKSQSLHLIQQRLFDGMKLEKINFMLKN